MFGLMVNGFGMVTVTFTKMAIGHLHPLVMCGSQGTGFRREMGGIKKKDIG
jgi:hypothetical protein